MFRVELSEVGNFPDLSILSLHDAVGYFDKSNPSMFRILHEDERKDLVVRFRRKEIELVFQVIDGNFYRLVNDKQAESLPTPRA